MKGCSSALGHRLFALLQVLPSPCNTWSADVTQHKASPQLHRGKKECLPDKNHFLKWRGHVEAEVNYSDGVNATKTNYRSKDKYRECATSFQTCPISLPLFCMRVWFFLPFFVCLISSLPFYILFSEQTDLFNFLHLLPSFIYSPLEFPGLASPLFPLNLPGVLKDFLQSAANRVRVILASHHKQYAAYPSCQPASIPAIIKA